MNEWLMIGIMAIPFLCLFGISEWLYYKRNVAAETTRKIVHAGTGLLTLLFPVVFVEWWQVALLCSAFLGILLLSMRYHFLPSVNAVERNTWGSVLFPIIVIVVFLFYLLMQQKQSPFHAYLFFYLPVLVMALADPAAAFAGNYFKRLNPDVKGKTNAGSIAFFITTFFVTYISGFLFSKSMEAVAIVYALIIAMVATAAERWSSKGWDNFTIPLSVMLLLYLIV